MSVAMWKFGLPCWRLQPAYFMSQERFFFYYINMPNARGKITTSVKDDKAAHTATPVNVRQ